MSQAADGLKSDGLEETSNQGTSGLDDLQKLFVRRLNEIRRRLIFAALFLLAFSILGYVVSQPLLDLLMKLHPDPMTLVFLSPSEAFFARLKMALTVGFLTSYPLLVGQIWSFAREFMDRRLQVRTLLLIPVSYVLFLMGAAVAVFGVLPFALRFLLGFRSEDLKPMLSVSPYVSFVMAVVLPLALIFQMPVVVMFLARLGILRPRTLASQRKHAILLIFVIAAILTPPDGFSQILMAIPLVLLFEVSLLFARLAAPRNLDEGEDEHESGT